MIDELILDWIANYGLDHVELGEPWFDINIKLEDFLI